MGAELYRIGTEAARHRKQLKGPFEKFEGRWSVAHIDKNSCQIDFDATYELPFLLNAITPEHLAKNFSKNIIDSFIERVS